MDAIEQITNDHRQVERLFGELEGGGAKARGETFARIKKELDVHAAIEEELLYPAVARANPSARDEVERSLAEHRVVKTLLRETAALFPQDRAFAANLAVLRRNFEEHVAEEEAPGGILEVASRSLGAEGRRELGRQMDEHRHALESGARGILTAAAEAVQSVVERGQKRMDRGTSASRRAVKEGAPAGRAPAPRAAGGARSSSRAGTLRRGGSRSVGSARRTARSGSSRAGSARSRSRSRSSARGR
jgi:hypothetical protein